MYMGIGEEFLREPVFCFIYFLILHLYLFPGVLKYLSFVLALIIKNLPNN